MKVNKRYSVVVFLLVMGLCGVCWGAPDMIGLEVPKPLLFGAPAFGWVAVSSDQWTEVQNVVERFGKVVGFSTLTTVQGTTKSILCRILVSFPQGEGALDQANNALQKANLPVLQRLVRAEWRICWERFSMSYYNYKDANGFPQLGESVIRLGHKMKAFSIGGDDRSLAKDLHTISEAIKKPYEFTKKRFAEECRYYVFEMPYQGMWMDLFNVSIRTAALGHGQQAVFEVRVPMNGSVSRPFNLPANYQDPWKD